MFPFFVLVCARCSLTNDSMTQQGVALCMILLRRLIRNLQLVLHVLFFKWFGNYLVHALQKTSW